MAYGETAIWRAKTLQDHFRSIVMGVKTETGRVVG